jgi:hypothetical protein
MKGISDETRRFVRTHFRSMLQVEAFLLLARDADRWWSADGVNLELRSSLHGTISQLERLRDSGLVDMQTAPETRFRYRPQPAEVQPAVDQLIVLHRERFHSLMELLYAPSRAQDFADAFKIKNSKDEEDG